MADAIQPRVEYYSAFKMVVNPTGPENVNISTLNRCTGILLTAATHHDGGSYLKRMSL